MDLLTLIIALSAILWYLIERGKTSLWGELPWGKWITIGCAAIGGFVFSFGFNLDILYACGLVAETSTLGIILTALTLMSGSSGISEVISFFKGRQ
jgi:hypothetical protein